MKTSRPFLIAHRHRPNYLYLPTMQVKYYSLFAIARSTVLPLRIAYCVLHNIAPARPRIHSALSRQISNTPLLPPRSTIHIVLPTSRSTYYGVSYWYCQLLPPTSATYRTSYGTWWSKFCRIWRERESPTDLSRPNILSNMAGDSPTIFPDHKILSNLAATWNQRRTAKSPHTIKSEVPASTITIYGNYSIWYDSTPFGIGIGRGISICPSIACSIDMLDAML
jgi:hypothetical protein